MIKLRNFTGGFGVSEDYIRLHDFLVESRNPEFSYARLDWMITHRPYLQEEHLHKIGIWEDDGKIVAADLFDTTLDNIFPVVLKGYEYLYPEMIIYAMESRGKPDNQKLQVFINKDNIVLQECARNMGLCQSDEKDKLAKYDLMKEIPECNLPEGFTIVSLEEEHEYEKYARCLFKGFSHEANGEKFTFDENMRKEQQEEMERQMVDLNLKLNVKAIDGSYVAHCGMWYDKKSDFAIIEPVATDPDYRKMGLGKAVVLEGLRRVKAMGAKYAYVGSGQKFYYAVGLVPYTEGYFWIEV